METTDWVRWGIVALMAIAQILEIVRSERAHKKEIAAKEAALAAKDAQIETLRELSSAKVREHYLAMKAQLEEFIEELKRQVEQKEKEIEALKDDHISKADFLNRLDLLQKHLKERSLETEKRLQELLKRKEQELTVAGVRLHPALMPASQGPPLADIVAAAETENKLKLPEQQE